MESVTDVPQTRLRTSEAKSASGFHLRGGEVGKLPPPTV